MDSGAAWAVSKIKKGLMIMESTDFEEDVEEKAKIFTIKTQVGKEQNTADLINSRAGKSKIKIPSILVTPELRGYIFIESYDKERIKDMIKTVSYARNMLEGDTPVEQIEHFLAPKPAVTSLAEGYTVEVTSGPFKGERAKIIKVDNTKNEITIELLEATVPIPITVPAESVRVLEKEEKKKEEGAEEAKGKEDKGEEAQEEEPETVDPFKL